MNKSFIINSLKKPDTLFDKDVKIQHTDFDRRKRLTEKESNEIRSLYEQGYTIENLAYMFGVYKETIRRRVDKDFYERYNSYRNKWAKNKYKKDPSSIRRTPLQEKRVKMDRIRYKRNLVGNGKLSESV